MNNPTYEQLLFLFDIEKRCHEYSLRRIKQLEIANERLRRACFRLYWKNIDLNNENDQLVELSMLVARKVSGASSNLMSGITSQNLPDNSTDWIITSGRTA